MRDERTQLLEDAKTATFQIVVVKSLNRFSRSMTEIFIITTQLAERGISVKTVE